MKFKLTRKCFGEDFTVGELYFINENSFPEFLCYTLEDKVREVKGQPVEQWKIPHETAIPMGEYPLSVTFSNRFGINLPLLGNVPGYTGVRIHTGNTDKDTDGCILVGDTWDGKSDWIGSSKIAFSKVQDKINSIKEPLIISIS